MTPNANRMMCECGMYYLLPMTCCEFCEFEQLRVHVPGGGNRWRREQSPEQKAAKVKVWKETHRGQVQAKARAYWQVKGAQRRAERQAAG